MNEPHAQPENSAKLFVSDAKKYGFSVLIGSHRVLLAVTLAVLTVLLRCEDGRYRVSGH